LVLFSFFVGSFLSPTDEKIKKDSFLVLDLTMNLTDRPADVSFEDITRQALTEEELIPSYHLREVVDTILASSAEKNIKGIFISGGFAPSGYGCGYETILEFRRALETFKQSGKKIIGYLHSPRQLDYLVYSICDELIMDPAGTMLLPGLSSEQLFLGDTFKKYGIGVQVVRTGRYKGAVEPFTNNKFSTENRIQVQNLLDRRWIHYLQSVATARSMKWQDLNSTLAQKFLWKSKDAKKAGKALKGETKGAPKGHYFTKSGNLVKGRMSADAKERGARKSDPKDKQRSKVPPVSQYNEEVFTAILEKCWKGYEKKGMKTMFGKRVPNCVKKEDIQNLVVGVLHEMNVDEKKKKKKKKDDRCTRRAKREYDTWPSAYASGAVVRCRRGEIWKKK